MGRNGGSPSPRKGRSPSFQSQVCTALRTRPCTALGERCVPRSMCVGKSVQGSAAASRKLTPPFRCFCLRPCPSPWRLARAGDLVTVKVRRLPLAPNRSSLCGACAVATYILMGVADRTCDPDGGAFAHRLHRPSKCQCRVQGRHQVWFPTATTWGVHRVVYTSAGLRLSSQPRVFALP